MIVRDNNKSNNYNGQTIVGYQGEVWLAEILQGNQPGSIILFFLIILFSLILFQSFLSDFKISFSLKSYKPWVPKCPHHLCQTAKVSERHSWQLLCVFRDNFFFGWYDREGRLFQESLSFSLLLINDFSCFRLKRLDTKSLECFCQVVEKAGSTVVCYFENILLKNELGPLFVRFNEFVYNREQMSFRCSYFLHTLRTSK